MQTNRRACQQSSTQSKPTYGCWVELWGAGKWQCTEQGCSEGAASGGTPHCVHMVGADVVKRRAVPSQLQMSRTTAWRMVEDDSRNLFIHLNYDFFTLQYTTYPLSQRTYAP